MEKYNLRYNPFIGDGDSSSYTAVDRERPYGPCFLVAKEECVNHVTKRMGSNLRALVQDFKGKKPSDGKGLSGRKNFYGRSIRDNKGNPKKNVRGNMGDFRPLLQHRKLNEAHKMP